MEKETIYTPERFNNDFESECLLLKRQTEIFFTNEYSHLQQYFKIDEAKRVLDVGCGIGTFLTLLLAQQPNTTAVGVDINAKFINHATQTEQELIENKRLTLHCGSIYNTSDVGLEPGSFDFVIARFVLQHLVQPLRALAELRQLVRPGGKVVIVTCSDRLDEMQPNIQEMEVLWEALWTDHASNAVQLKTEVESTQDPHLQSTYKNLDNPNTIIITNENNSTENGEGKSKDTKQPVSVINSQTPVGASGEQWYVAESNEPTIFGPRTGSALRKVGLTMVQSFDLAVDSLDNKSLEPFIPIMSPRQFEHLVAKKLVDEEVYSSAVEQFDVLREKQFSDPTALRYIAYEFIIGGKRPTF